jgi:hypothetical protein
MLSKSSKLSHISEENLMSFLTEPESQGSDEEPSASLVHLVEDDETTLLNDFLSSAIVDYGLPGVAMHGQAAWNALDGQMVAPSSPPPPLFIDESPDMDPIFKY